MTKLLVSVQSLPEARDAACAGAHVIDIKDPARGSLGRPDASVVDEIVGAMAGALPISVALGDLDEAFSSLASRGVDYAKIGLAGWQARDWTGPLVRAGQSQNFVSRNTGLIAVAYADWELADAPPPREILRFAAQHHWAGLLVDTSIKNGRSLRQYCTESVLRDLIKQCRDHDLIVALAGSLQLSDIPAVAGLEPDIIAVRSAACRNGDRTHTIDPDRVRSLVHVLAPVSLVTS